ncbi:MAG TPA: hypothetical protein VD902_07810, partial [Symbiobacteriaceae bacterium]|nr:hypothetical protein [Symbiobacteriaceae bacterium]
MTRRQFLAGAAAATATTSLGFASGSGAVRFRHLSAHRVQFELGGEPVWVIDTRHFGGRPVLEVVEAEGQLSLALAGALYPGTSLPAGLALELKNPSASEPDTFTGALMNLRLELGGYEAVGVPFAGWLAGAEAARSRVDLPDLTATTPNAGCSLTLTGTAAAEYRPDGTLTLRRRSLAQLAYGENLVPADHVTLALGPGPSSRVTLHREGRRWPDILPAAAPRFGRLSAGGTLYEQALLEFWEPGRAPQTARLTFEGVQSSDPLSFLPAGRLVGKDGRALSFPLQAPRYTITFGNKPEASLTARLSREPVWAMAGQTVLVLGANAKTPPFAWTERAGAATALEFSPTLVTLASEGMSGMIVSASAASTGGEVS